MKIGFIGMGNMAEALLKGFINGSVSADDIFAYAPHRDKLLKKAEKYGFAACDSLFELAEKADMIIVACKPHQIEGVLEQIGQKLGGKSVLSIAAGWDYNRYSSILNDNVRIQCILPNTPMSVGKGMIIIEEKNSLSAEERAKVIKLLSACGKVIELPANLISAAAAVTGCGPAFIDMVIEAMGDGLVKNGIPRKEAYEMVCHTMIGTAELMLSTGLHPGELKDQVCSPGGTTIRGVAALENAGVRSAFIKAIDATLENNFKY